MLCFFVSCIVCDVEENTILSQGEIAIRLLAEQCPSSIHNGRNESGPELFSKQMFSGRRVIIIECVLQYIPPDCGTFTLAATRVMRGRILNLYDGYKRSNQSTAIFGNGARGERERETIDGAYKYFRVKKLSVVRDVKESRDGLSAMAFLIYPIHVIEWYRLAPLLALFFTGVT